MTSQETRAVLITGCSSGIGYACAHGLKERGYRVFASARQHRDVERLSAEGLEALRLDLDDPNSIQEAVDRVLSQTGGRLYALFNNGGYGQVGAAEDLSREVLRAQLETNLLGWHDLTCRLIPGMRAQGHGRIIQNSSVLGLVTLAYRGAYVASKFALESRRPRPRYYLTVQTYLLGSLRRALSSRGLDRILMRASGAGAR